VRELADVMARNWVWVLGLLVVVALVTLVIRLFVSDRKGETFQYLVVLVLVIVIVPQVWVWVADLFTSPARPSVAQPTSGKMQLTLPPFGKSERIIQPPGMRVMVGGVGWRIHCVYADGREISFTSGQTPCPAGHMPYVYFSNETGHINTLTYMLEPLRK